MENQTEQTEKRILLGEFKDYCQDELTMTTKIYLVSDELWIEQVDAMDWKGRKTFATIDAIHWELLADCIISASNILLNQSK